MADRSIRARARSLGVTGALLGGGLAVGLSVVAAQTAPGRAASSSNPDQAGAPSDAGQVFLLRPPGAAPVATPAPAVTTTGGS